MNIWMKEALREAAKGLGDTSPNPAVGAVIVSRGIILARGHHRNYGGPHAEIDAMAGVSDQRLLRKSTMIVTLEPCNHFGKTPPCTEAIVRAGIRRVIVGIQDPHRIVAGKGIRRLRAAGIRVDLLDDPNVQAFYEPYRLFHAQKRCFVTLKLAISTDGKLAASNSSAWITGPKARQEVQKIRRRVDAILVGRGTAVADNPRLTLRPPYRAGRKRMPIRLILSSGGALPPRLRLLRDHSAPTWIVAGPLEKLTRKLAARGIVHLLVEGGAKTADSFLQSDLVDEILLFVSPKILGHNALDAFGPAPKHARDWQLINIQKFGKDIRLQFRPKK